MPSVEMSKSFNAIPRMREAFASPSWHRFGGTFVGNNRRGGDLGRTVEVKSGEQIGPARLDESCDEPRPSADEVGANDVSLAGAAAFYFGGAEARHDSRMTARLRLSRSSRGL